jgi:hypothetical protein
MALTEDLGIFLADFGVSCTAGAVTALGILDMPGQIMAGGMVISTDYTLTAKAEDFGDLLYGTQISVNGTLFTVREATLQDDGRMVQLSLQRSVATDAIVASTPMDGNGVEPVIADLQNDQLDPDVDGGTASSSYFEGNVIDGGAT